MATNIRVVMGAVTFTAADVRQARLVEEFNPLAITVPVSQIEILLYSEDADFSIISPAGDYASLVYKQPIQVYMDVNGTEIFIGKYFLDTWESVSDTLTLLKCIDEIGILDTLQYRGGIWITPTTMGALINEIFTELGSQYEMDPDLEAVEIKGWIPICTYREALQQIVFAGGAYIQTARQEGFIKIAKLESLGTITRGIRSGVPKTGQSHVWQRRWRASQWDLTMPVYTITNAEQGINPQVIMRTQVTGVEITMHDISTGTGNRPLFDGTLPVGTHEITFSQPMHTLSVTGSATITESGANYAILNVTVEENIALSGLVYNDAQKLAAVYLADLAGNKPNILKITEASLVNTSNGATIAQRVYDYYLKRHTQKSRLYAPLAAIGGSVLIDTLYNRQIRGTIEVMTTDLTGGFISDVDIVGEVEPL